MRLAKKPHTLVIILFVLVLSACAPKVGTQQWCDALEEEPKQLWSDEDALAYAKYCLVTKRK